MNKLIIPAVIVAIGAPGPVARSQAQASRLAEEVLAAAQRVLTPSREVIALVAPEGAIPAELSR